MTDGRLSDKALSILAFAAYHQLESGQPVSSVIQSDDQGHRADPQGVEELTSKGLARTGDKGVEFTEQGAAALQRIVEAIRAA
jgi:hypothetical protein